MNAIVYGWTRDDFVQTIAINNRTEELSSDAPNNYSNATELTESSSKNNFDETINANSDRDSD